METDNIDEYVHTDYEANIIGQCKVCQLRNAICSSIKTVCFSNANRKPHLERFITLKGSTQFWILEKTTIGLIYMFTGSNIKQNGNLNSEKSLLFTLGGLKCCLQGLQGACVFVVNQWCLRSTCSSMTENRKSLGVMQGSRSYITEANWMKRIFLADI